MTTSRFIVALSVFALAFLEPPKASAEVVVAESIEWVLAKSDRVIVGRVVKVETVIDSDKREYEVTTVAISVVSTNLLVRSGLTGAAFFGAILGVLLTLALARGVQHTLRLLLAGVVVGVVLGAATSLVLVFSPDSVQAMQAFLLGSTGFVGWAACLLMLAVLPPCVAAAWSLSRALDGLSLGESTAASLGLPLLPLRAALIGILALATGTAVAQTGLIAFVGLAAPHLVRSVVHVTHGNLMLLASLTGGVLLSSADLLARWLIAPQELPVGVLTAVLGGGYLLWLMHRGGSTISGPVA